jgi:hypothetical protein
LEDRIQEHVSLYGYGNQKTWQENKIHDVAINAVGGWIMQLKRGARFIWSQGEGRLPKELQEALAEGERRKWTISVALSLSLFYYQDKEHLLTSMARNCS